ncbi:TRIM2 [Branchiostoma lanceolatum]|uniref:TRIM2 protein n=1 Tax=Branchiostoma lanceolatum TaxID=7740 RepID=A0A8K0EVN7_BRALA|nr:TRIM2 [Branchiostoma lanceolatum]
MASGVANKIKEEFLMCQICFEDYHEPKVLPCQHTFCKKCLGKMVAKMGKLTCPNCRRECLLPQNGVEGLPIGFFVNKLRDILGNGGGVTRSTREDKSATTSYSFDYRENISTACTESNRLPIPRQPVLRTSPPRATPLGQPPSTQGLPRQPATPDRAQGRHPFEPDRVLPILSWLKEQDIMTAQDLHDNWDDVKDMVDMTNAMRQHITEALGEFSQAGH